MLAKPKCTSAATVTIRGAGDYSFAGRRRIAAWLRKQAGFLEKHSKELAPRYTANYWYQKKN